VHPKIVDTGHNTVDMDTAIQENLNQLQSFLSSLFMQGFRGAKYPAENAMQEIVAASLQQMASEA